VTAAALSFYSSKVINLNLVKIEGFEDFSAGLKGAYLFLFSLACLTLKMKALRSFEKW
jgi:hypothetical protein